MDESPGSQARGMLEVSKAQIVPSFQRRDLRPESDAETPRKTKHQRRDKADPEKEFERAKMSAMGSLSLKMHTRQQLRDKLRDKEYAADVTERALDRMEELDMLSDANFAEIFARSKWNQSKWAPRRISMELQSKGVSQDICEAALKRTFGSNKLGIRMSNDEQEEPEDGVEWDRLDTESGLDEQLIQTIQRRHQSMGALKKEVKSRRLIAWMQRRGHSWDVVSGVMKHICL